MRTAIFKKLDGQPVAINPDQIRYLCPSEGEGGGIFIAFDHGRGVVVDATFADVRNKLDDL